MFIGTQKLKRQIKLEETFKYAIFYKDTHISMKNYIKTLTRKTSQKYVNVYDYIPICYVILYINKIA